MTWVNTNLATEEFVIFFGLIDLIRDDDDHYLHHGQLSQLSQLLSVDGNKNAYQVLLTPRQTEIGMLDLTNRSYHDAVTLVANLKEASLDNHGLAEYIPNLLQQLRALSNESLYDNYQAMIITLNNEIKVFDKQRSDATVARIATLDPVDARGLRGKHDAELLLKRHDLMRKGARAKSLTNEIKAIRDELMEIMKDPVRFPLGKIFTANQALSDKIKAQINK